LVASDISTSELALNENEYRNSALFILVGDYEIKGSQRHDEDDEGGGIEKEKSFDKLLDDEENDDDDDMDEMMDEEEGQIKLEGRKEGQGLENDSFISKLRTFQWHY
jgi:hypothetical protein